MNGFLVFLGFWILILFILIFTWLFVRGRVLSFKFSLFFFKIILFILLSMGCFYNGLFSLEFYFSFLFIIGVSFILLFLEGSGLVG